MNRIKEARERHGMSQKELAIEMRVSQPTVCDWEKGNKSPSVKNLRKLSELLHVSTDYLLSEGTPEVEPKGDEAMLKIKELCHKTGIQQKDLAEQLGIATSTLSQYVTGRSQPDHDTLIKIADIFNVSIDYLLDHEQRPLKAVPQELNAAERRLIDQHRALTESCHSCATTADIVSLIVESLCDHEQRPAAAKQELSADELELIKKYRRLSADGIRHINDQMEFALVKYPKSAAAAEVI